MDVPLHFEDSDESTEDYENLVPTVNVSRSILLDRNPIDYLLPDVSRYTFKTWDQIFPKHIDLLTLIFDKEWKLFLAGIRSKNYFNQIESDLADCKDSIVPPPELLFNSLNTCSLENVKVVIMGQDPFINTTKINGKEIAQAMGLSFSVCKGYKKPPSLNNIFDNLVKYEHLDSVPNKGCLSGWALQGVLLLNASLTTTKGKSNAHKNIWKEFTEDLISYINDHTANVVFLVWGKDANNICKNVDPNKHKLITSSHPSPYSCDKPVQGLEYGSVKFEAKRKTISYKPFSKVDHFGKANKYLRSVDKTPILWDIIV